MLYKTSQKNKKEKNLYSTYIPTFILCYRYITVTYRNYLNFASVVQDPFVMGITRSKARGLCYKRSYTVCRDHMYGKVTTCPLKGVLRPDMHELSRFISLFT
jgi:hypothetical protein